MDTEYHPTKLITLRETTRRLGLAQQTGYNMLWLKKGVLAEIPRYRLGRSWRFSEQDVEDFLKRRRVEPQRAGRGQE